MTCRECGAPTDWERERDEQNELRERAQAREVVTMKERDEAVAAVAAMRETIANLIHATRLSESCEDEITEIREHAEASIVGTTIGRDFLERHERLREAASKVVKARRNGHEDIERYIDVLEKEIG